MRLFVTTLTMYGHRPNCNLHVLFCCPQARNWGSANLLSNKPNTPQVPQHGPEDQLPSPGAEEASYQSHYQQQQDMGYGGGGYAPTPGRGAYH